MKKRTKVTIGVVAGMAIGAYIVALLRILKEHIEWREYQEEDEDFDDDFLYDEENEEDDDGFFDNEENDLMDEEIAKEYDEEDKKAIENTD